MRRAAFAAALSILSSFALAAEDGFCVETGLYLNTPFVILGSDTLQTVRLSLAAGSAIGSLPSGGSIWGKGVLSYSLGQWMNLEVGGEASFDFVAIGSVLRSRLSPGLSVWFGYEKLGIDAYLRFEPAVIFLDKADFPRLSLSILPTALRYRGFDEQALYVEYGLILIGYMTDSRSGK